MAAGRGSNTKPPLERIAVLGANGHIGRPLAALVSAKSPSTGLKLVIRNEDHRPALAGAFPQAEICLANYYDLASLEAAMSGVQGAFIVTPDFLDEQRAMTNFVYAARTKAYIGRPDADQYYINYFQFEQDNETVWRKSDIVEFLTGRPAKTLRQWLSDNKHHIIG